ncbi:MAG: ribbon-helix-helix protein, CopG family [Candidatus Lokiarchaeota archaeon]|nr:ribbon-helix-helix protein, CopG family [Candidatus Lokiarchaeota archaeon]
MPKETDEADKKKIISVTMSQSLVKRIDELVKERVARSRAQMIEDAVRKFLDFTVHKWTERGLYVNTFRFALESESQVSLFFSTLTPDDQYELGRTAGKQAPIADIVKLFYGTDIKKEEGLMLAMERLEEYGWGSISLHDDLIVISSPFYPAHFLKGYFESLLDIDLELMETNVKENVALKMGSS